MPKGYAYTSQGMKLAKKGGGRGGTSAGRTGGMPAGRKVGSGDPAAIRACVNRTKPPYR